MSQSLTTTESLSLERRAKMNEAREAIIERLASGLPARIDLDRFLNAVVSELGRMMSADRCDVIQLTGDGMARISHEWRASDKIPSSEGVALPVDLQRLAKTVDLAKPIRLNDTSAPGLDEKIRLLAATLGTRSLLVVPIILGQEVLGLIGLHDTQQPRVWLDEEVQFLQSIGRHLAVGYEYTRLFTDKQQEAQNTRALLEIANALNAHSDFGEVAALVLERAVTLVGADYCALGVLDPSGQRITLAGLKAAPDFPIENIQTLIDSRGRSIDLSKEFSGLLKLISEGKTLRLIDTELPAAFGFVFNTMLGGRAALVAPVKVGGRPFGELGLVWSGVREGFADHEIALVEGIADQIGTALERDQLSAEVMRLRSALHERHAESNIIGQAPAIRRAIELSLTVADTQTSVLIRGESGTGKELLANLIHFNSGREDKPYIKLNCGAIPETLLETELFGHEKGAFTDAHSKRVGRFEEADGGTLFLDEIGEMSLSAQVRLLRVLQDGEFTRVGGNQVIKSDVRVIAATNVDLEKAVEDGRFRRDLFYRLSVFPVELPPLRERPADIHPLVIHFVEKYRQKTGRFVSDISRDALAALQTYDWPGNVRELENAIERAVIIASGRQIELQDLPEPVNRITPSAHARAMVPRALPENPEAATSIEVQVPSPLDYIEQQLIEATLAYTGGDKAQAARLLGIGRKTLYRKLEAYGDGGTVKLSVE
jgi:transcriptional regulator with GAF, ATPase, and Fis domain